MAAKKTPPTAEKKAPAGVNKYDAELAALAAQGVKAEENVGGQSNTINVKGAQFYYHDQLLGNTLRVVILDHSLENAYYPEKFDPANPQPPSCFSLGRVEDDLVPHDKCEEKQGDEQGMCHGCVYNAFGSGENGSGKACKNTRRLMIMLESGLEEISDATVAILKPPVTSLKAWAGFVKNLKDTTGKPTLSYITEIKAQPHPSNQYELSFKTVEEVDGKLIGQLLDKRREHEKMLFEPYGPRIVREKAKGGRGGANQKLAGKKPVPAAKKKTPAKGARR